MLNATLKEELRLIEQFSICADNTDRLSHIIESGIACPDISDKIYELVNYYEQFRTYLGRAPVSQKSLYNMKDDTKYIDCDMDAI